MTTPTTSETRTYTESEAADRLGMHRSSLALWRKSGKLPAGMVLPRKVTPALSRVTPIPYDAQMIDTVARDGWEAVLEAPDSVNNSEEATRG